MRVAVIGLGTQGRKRAAVAGDDVVATVDPLVETATHRSIEELPGADYDAALVCVPDEAKPALLDQLLGAGKHVLVEKPLAVPAACDLAALADLARSRGAALYTAYNHRFEPHLVHLRDLVREGMVGEPYRLSMFYGNGTARDVLGSWRDVDLGVVTDLAPHMLDLCLFLGLAPQGRVEVWSCSAEENQAPDHFLVGFPGARPAVTLEGTVLSWRNTFRLDLLGSQGSAHISGLCKWGPTTLTVRSRVLPSGKPPERSWTLEQADPTWREEYAHFLGLCAVGAVDVEADLWIDRVLAEIAAAASVSAR